MYDFEHNDMTPEVIPTVSAENDPAQEAFSEVPAEMTATTETVPAAPDDLQCAPQDLTAPAESPVKAPADPAQEVVYLRTEAAVDDMLREFGVEPAQTTEQTVQTQAAPAEPVVPSAEPVYHGSYDTHTTTYGAGSYGQYMGNTSGTYNTDTYTQNASGTGSAGQYGANSQYSAGSANGAYGTNGYQYYDTNENYGFTRSGQTVYSQDFTKQPETAEKKKKKSGGGRVWFAILCILLSLFSGFGGAWLYNKYFTKEPSVIYQTVEPANTSPMVSENTSLADVIDRLKPSVVEVQTEIMTTGGFFGQSISSGAGSGVVLTADGYIATNYHVIKNANSIKVIMPDTKEYTASVVGFDEINDLAVIKIDASGLTPVTIADSSAVRVGDTAIAIGNPLGTLGGTVTTGIVSALDREIEVEGQSMVLMQTNAAVSPGNSGGGLFNINGELIGIVNAKSSAEDVEGLGFAIPSNIVSEVTKDIMENQTTVHASNGPIFGITIVTINNAEDAASYHVSRFGVYIVAVTRGYGGDKAGLEVGDYIVSVDGTAISAGDEITEILGQHKAGDVLEVQVIRNGKILTYQVELMNYND